MYNYMLVILLVLVVSYYFNKTHTQPILTENKEQFKDKSTGCIKNINISNKLKTHLDKVKTLKINNNILQHIGPIPFNYSNKLEYSVMNNNGIKDLKKRQLYEKNNINNGVILPYNKRVLLKNLNRNVFNHNFKDIRPPITNCQNISDYTTKCNNNTVCYNGYEFI